MSAYSVEAWRSGGGFEHRDGDQFSLDLRFDLLGEEAAQVGGGRLRPGPRGQLCDGRAQHFLRQIARVLAELPRVAEAQCAAAIWQ